MFGQNLGQERCHYHSLIHLNDILLLFKSVYAKIIPIFLFSFLESRKGSRKKRGGVKATIFLISFASSLTHQD